jgi:hypothetical protein
LPIAKSTGSAADTKRLAIVPTEAQLAAVLAWIMGCEVSWLTCPTKEAALALKREFQPPFTKR